MGSSGNRGAVYKIKINVVSGFCLRQVAPTPIRSSIVT